MMHAVLADLALEVEGAVALVMRLARAFDRAASDPREAAYARLVTPAAKYWICKTAPGFIYEAMECLGGNGYVEESVLPRLYREAPVNAIWEGSGNVMCLDVLRALRRDEEAADILRALASDVAPRSGEEMARVDRKNDPESEATARVTVGRLAALAAAAALNATAPSQVADAFVETRLVAPRGALYGTSSIDAPTAELILQRALPEL
jgi:putative acyl-CoA dehydrogenase